MIPKRIDSHGNPGIAGICSGVWGDDVAADELWCVAVAAVVPPVFELAVVEVRLLVVDEVTLLLVAAVVWVLEAALVEVVTELDCVEAVVGCWVVGGGGGGGGLVLDAVTPPGGSKCMISPNVVGSALTCVPTASPFVLERKASPFNAPVLGIAGLGNVLHEVPS